MTSGIKLRGARHRGRIVQVSAVGIVLLAGSIAPAQAQSNGNGNPFLSGVFDRSGLVGSIINRVNPDSGLLQGPRPEPVEVPQSQQLGGFFRPGLNRIGEAAESVSNFLGATVSRGFFRPTINRSAEATGSSSLFDSLTPDFDEAAFNRERNNSFGNNPGSRPAPSPSPSPFPFLSQFQPTQNNLGPGILEGGRGNSGNSGSSGNTVAPRKPITVEGLINYMDNEYPGEGWDSYSGTTSGGTTGGNTTGGSSTGGSSTGGSGSGSGRTISPPRSTCGGRVCAGSADV